jgi:hypothetical protein
MPPARFDVFISTLSLPTAIARDPSCQCWAVSNILGSPAIAWFNDAGTPHKGKGPVPAGPYNPYGLGVVPGGDLYFVDEHIACDASGCGPVVHGEGAFKLTFEHGVPSTPQAIVTGIDFPLGHHGLRPDAPRLPDPAVGAWRTPARRPGGCERGASRALPMLSDPHPSGLKKGNIDTTYRALENPRRCAPRAQDEATAP